MEKEITVEFSTSLKPSRKKRLLIVCKHQGEHYIRQVLIEDDGKVHGIFGNELPRVEMAFSEPANSASWAPLMNGEILLIGNLKDTFHTRLIRPWNDCYLSNPTETNLCHKLQERFGSSFLSNSVFIIGDRGMIYILGCRTKSETFWRFDYYNTRTVESLPPPPPLLDPTFQKICGYVVVEPHDLILFSTQHRKQDEFLSFNVSTKQWVAVNVDTKRIDGFKFDPYFPYYISNPQVMSGIYPFFGRAEFVDGVIFGCLLRTVVTYRLIVDDKGSASLEALGLFSLDHASSFKKFPFGIPLLYSRHLTHLGNNMFSLVETVDNQHNPSHFQPVYITTFLLPLDYQNHTDDYDEKRRRFKILDSTVRFVDNGDLTKFPDATIVFCYASSEAKETLFHDYGFICYTSISDYITKRMLDFCKGFIELKDEMIGDATLLYVNFSHELEKSKDPFVKFFLNYMACVLHRRIGPNLTLLVNKRLDKGNKKRLKRGWGRRRKLNDPIRSLDCHKSIFLISVFQSRACAVYELKINRRGVIGGSIISPEAKVVQQSHDYISTLSIGSLGHDVYIFPCKLGTYNISDGYIVNVQRNILAQKHAKPPGEKHRMIIISNGSKLFALSAPSKEPACIPKPAFECFDEVSGSWEALEDAPFHSKEIEALVTGYAVVDEFILVSLENSECDFYSYNVETKIWMPATMVTKNPACEYRPFNGKAEYVDGKIYVYFCRTVYEFVVEKYGDSLCLCAPTELNGLKLISPPIVWCSDVTECITHLGANVFCIVETGACSFSGNYQYACITTFAVTKASNIDTWHSTVRVLDTRDLGSADVCHFFSPR